MTACGASSVPTLPHLFVKWNVLNKVLWEHSWAHPHVVCGSSHATAAELSSHDRNCYRPWNLTLSSKRWLTPEIEYRCVCTLERVETRTSKGKMHHVLGELVCYWPSVSGIMDERGKMLRASWYNPDSLRPLADVHRGGWFPHGRPRVAGRHVGVTPGRGHWNPRASTRSGHPKKQPQEGSKVTWH